MIGEIGVVKESIESSSPGWVFVHGEWWRAITAIAPKDDVYQQGCEQMIGIERRVLMVRLQDGKVAVGPFGPAALGHSKS